jgi:isocitrate dehydrogenase (NAD+)
MAHHVTAVRGDSPAQGDAARALVAAAGVAVDWDFQDFDATGQPTAELLASAARSGAVLLGHRRSKDGKPAPIVHLRRALDCHVNLRPLHAVRGIPTRFPKTDLLIVRETTEDVYAQLEHESIPGTFESLKVTTRAACERVARIAFETARAKGRKKVTIIHKANIMKKSDGLFLTVGRQVAADYPDVAVEDVIVDALCMKLVRDPSQFDVLLCGNLFGDIVSDLGAGLVGGRANAPSVNLGRDGVAVFTSGHGEEERWLGTPEANPTSMCFAAVLLLRHLGEDAAADRLMAALGDTLEAGERPIPLGGDLTAPAFADAVARRL